MVRDYHRWMGGVDVHDQLRLQQKLSPAADVIQEVLQRHLHGACRCGYYIVFREAQKRMDMRQAYHAEFLLELLAQLLDLKKEDFAERVSLHVGCATCSMTRTL